MRRPARLAGIPGFGIDEVAEAAGDDPEVLRLENLDTDLPVPDGVVAATRRAVGVDEYNSYLPFDGRADLKAAIAAHFGRRSRTTVDPSQITITGGDGDGLNNALNATTDVGDEVIVTDPTYAGIVNRVRLVGARPQVVPLHVEAGAWRLDPDRLQSAITAKTRAVLLMNPAFPHGVRLNDDEWRAIASVFEVVGLRDERVIRQAGESADTSPPLQSRPRQRRPAPVAWAWAHRPSRAPRPPSDRR